MAVITVNEANYDSVVLQSSGLVLADFYADWCGPCRALAPIVEEVAEALPEITVCKINIDENRALADQMGILSVPTLLLIQNKTVQATLIGLRSKAEILAEIEKHK